MVSSAASNHRVTKAGRRSSIPGWAIPKTL